MRPLLCVDFDGTIWDGDLLPGCVEKLSELRQRFYIGIFSARQTAGERQQMRTLLDTLGVPYDEILGVKPNAVAFIDDKGLHFTNWADINL